MTTARRVARVALAIAALVPLVGCRVSGLDLVQDKRVKIVAPRDRQEVTLPLQVEWTARDFTLSSTTQPDGGFFGVFADVNPPPPGEDLEYLVDENCRRLPNCPTQPYLNDRGIYWTTDTKMMIDLLSPAIDRHEVTVVFLDNTLTRVGDAAFWVGFKVKDHE